MVVRTRRAIWQTLHTGHADQKAPALMARSGTAANRCESLATGYSRCRFIRPQLGQVHTMSNSDAMQGTGRTPARSPTGTEPAASITQLTI